jgi:IPT/TIG domain
MPDLNINSTISDILAQFIVTDTHHDPGVAAVVVEDTAIKLFWHDTSRVRLDISVMSTTADGVRMMVPPPLDIPGGGNPNNPVPVDPPVLTSLSPDTEPAGGNGFDLTIEGTGFVGGSRVRFGQAVGNGIFVSPTEMMMHVGPDGTAFAGTVQVSVQAPGGAVSNQLPFTIV